MMGCNVREGGRGRGTMQEGAPEWKMGVGEGGGCSSEGRRVCGRLLDGSVFATDACSQ